MESSDLESAVPALSAPLLDSRPPRSKLKILALTVAAAVLVLLGFGAVAYYCRNGLGLPASDSIRAAADGKDYAWTNEMLRWQRTGFHFQPQKNFMSDPNGTLLTTPRSRCEQKRCEQRIFLILWLVDGLDFFLTKSDNSDGKGSKPSTS